jgi:hypothetical protein
LRLAVVTRFSDGIDCNALGMRAKGVAWVFLRKHYDWGLVVARNHAIGVDRSLALSLQYECDSEDVCCA